MLFSLKNKLFFSIVPSAILLTSDILAAHEVPSESNRSPSERSSSYVPIEGKSFSLSPDAKSFDLPETVALALRTHPRIFSEHASRRAVNHTKDQARSGYFPKIDVQVGAGYEHTRRKYGTNALGRSPVSGSVSQDRYNPSLSVRQMLFDGFETPRRVAKADEEIIQQTRKVEEIQQQVAFQAAEAYIAVRRFQRQLRIAQENLENHEEILENVRSMVQGGIATVADIHMVESRLHDAAVAVRDIEGDLDSTIASFIEIVGQEPGYLHRARLNQALLPATLEEALTVAREKNNSLLFAQAAVRVAKADLEITESPFYPSLHLEADAKRNIHVNAEAGHETQFSTLLVARVNFFNGGKDIARKQEMIERLSAATYQQEAERRKVEKEIRFSYAERMSAKRQAETLRKVVGSKEKVRVAFLEQFKVGKRSLLDILDAAREWFLAKGSLVTADATEDSTSVRMLAAMGHLVDALEPSSATEDLVHKEEHTQGKEKA